MRGDSWLTATGFSRVASRGGEHGEVPPFCMCTCGHKTRWTDIPIVLICGQVCGRTRKSGKLCCATTMEEIVECYISQVFTILFPKAVYGMNDRIKDSAQ